MLSCPHTQHRTSKGVSLQKYFEIVIGPGSLDGVAGLQPCFLILSARAKVLEQLISHVFCADSYHMRGGGGERERERNERKRGRGAGGVRKKKRKRKRKRRQEGEGEGEKKGRGRRRGGRVEGGRRKRRGGGRVKEEVVM